MAPECVRLNFQLLWSSTDPPPPQYIGRCLGTNGKQAVGPSAGMKMEHTAGRRGAEKETLFCKIDHMTLQGLFLFFPFWSLRPAVECTCCKIPAHYENINFFSYQWDLSGQNLLLEANKIFSAGRSSVMNLCS